jgi:OOP family OmpA-OmpF porin
MKKILLITVALPLLFLGAPALAQNRAGAVTLSPFVGGYMFDCFQRLDNNWYYGLRVGYNYTAHWGSEAMFGMVPTSSKARGYDGRSVSVFRYGIDVLYHLWPDRKFVPFLAAGFGDIQINDPSGLNDHDRGMFDYGVGVKYFLTENVALRADVRHDLFCEFNDPCNNLEYTGGLTILFGGKEPAVAAPAPLPPVATACNTSPMNGATNVSVAKKITANFSGPMPKGSIKVTGPGSTPVNGAAAYDEKTRTMTFTPDAPFAPDTTYNAEIKNTGALMGTAMNSNCVWSFTTAPVVLIELDDTHFAHDSSTLTPRGKAIMDQNIQTLKANPKLNFLIAGYTSASGSDEYNQKLSERRATSVRDYFINEGGIAPDRLKQIGYGENRPTQYEIDPEDIESRAAQANRRVLFTIIVK